MNRTNDRASIFPGEIAKDFHHICGCERIQTGRWLVEENETWVRDQFDTNGGSFTLTTGDTLDKWASNPGIGALRQLEVENELVNARDLHWKTAWQLEFGCEL